LVFVTEGTLEEIEKAVEKYADTHKKPVGVVVFNFEI